jgi:hypothetical protein
MTCAVNGQIQKDGKVLGSDSCSTSGCHGGGGLNRGAHGIWNTYDPHSKSSETLKSAMSRAMVRQLGQEDATVEKSCTICHAPNKQVDASLFAGKPLEQDLESVSCANCHGGAEKWLLSHTREDFPKDALAQLGMKRLDTSYQRANSCVACHQNLSDELVKANHPPLAFELDGMLLAQGKHWREEDSFSHAETWLVGQAVALREAAAQAVREPGEGRDAEIEAIRELIKTAGTSLVGSGQDLVVEADEYAKRISGKPIDAGQTRAILNRLVGNREPFAGSAFEKVSEEKRMMARGYYAGRLVLALDRLNEALANGAAKGPVPEQAMKDLMDAVKTPVAFDEEISNHFLEKLDAAAKGIQ